MPVTDIILGAILLLVVVLSAIRGIIKTVLDMVGMMAALIGARLASPFLAPVLYKTFVQPKVLDALTREYGALSATVSSNAGRVVDSLDFLPKALVRYINANGIMNTDAVNRALQSTVGTASELESKLISPVLTSIMQALCFIAILIILGIIFRIISTLVARSIQKTKKIRKADHILGAVFGILKGFVVVLIMVAVFYIAGEVIELVAEFNENSPVYSFLLKTFMPS